MNKTIRRLTISVAAAIPAVAMLAGSAGAVSQYSKVTNGDFSNGTTGWMAKASPLAKITAPSNTGFVSNAFNSASASKTYAYQCFPITGGLKYQLSGKIYIPLVQKRDGQANLGIVFYAGDDCTDQVGAAYTLPVDEAGTWKQQSITPTAPNSAKSAMVRLGVEKFATGVLQLPSGKFGAYFDDIEVLQKSIKLPDGPIIVNPTATPTPKGPIIKIPVPTATPTPKGPIIKIPVPTTTPTPPVDDQPADDPQDPAPDPNPDPQPPADDQPNDEPQPEPEQPANEPVPGDDQTTEEDVPGPDLPAPDSNDDDSAPADNGGDDNGGDDNGDDAPANPGDDENGSGTGSNVETLGSTGKPWTSKSPDKPGNPTPAAPSTGNASENDGLIGNTELAIGGGLALAGLGLALVAFARSRRTTGEEPLE